MRVAIAQGKVVAVLQGDARLPRASTHLVVEAPEWVRVGDSFENGIFTADPNRESDDAKAALAASDKEMPRVVEDLIDALVAKGVIAREDLPGAAQAKLADRAMYRAKVK